MFGQHATAPPNGVFSPTSSSSSTSTSSSSGGGASSSGAPTDGTVDGGDPLIVYRPYEVTVPSTYDAAKPAPLVILLHGYTSNAKDQDTYFGLYAFLEAHPKP